MLFRSERDTKPDSRMTNPAKAHTNEKWELLTQFRTTLKKAADSVSSHLVKDITPGIAQFGVHGTTMISAGLALPAMIADCATHICKLGMAKVNGWKMLRLSDGYMIAAKFFANKAETIYLIDAPKYVANTQIHHVASELDQVVTGERIVLARNEIHRVAEAAAEQDGMSVRRRTRDDLRGDVGTCAGTVVDDDLLPEHAVQFFGHVARQEVARSARREADHDAQRTRRKEIGRAHV